MTLEPVSLTDAIDQAFATEWTKAKQTAVPDAGAADRRLIFAAVARGLIQYLSDRQGTVITRVSLTADGSNTPVGYTVSGTELDVSVG